MRFGLTVQSDLKTNRPKHYAYLKRTGTLRGVAERVQTLAVDAMEKYLSAGMSYNQALELVFWDLLRVPTEQEEPETPERFLSMGPGMDLGS